MSEVFCWLLSVSLQVCGNYLLPLGESESKEEEGKDLVLSCLFSGAELT